MTATPSTTNWRSAGACLSADPDLFFPISATGRAEKQIAKAKLICAGCTVRLECLEFAMNHDQLFGIWGGTTPQERRVLRAAMARQAWRMPHPGFRSGPPRGSG